MYDMYVYTYIHCITRLQACEYQRGKRRFLAFLEGGVPPDADTDVVLVRGGTSLIRHSPPP